MDDLYDEYDAFGSVLVLFFANQNPRFGNYIGEAESDEEQQEQVPQAFKFDEAFDDEEEEEEANDQQLMEVDGKFCACFLRLPQPHAHLHLAQRDPPMPLFYTKTSNITRARSKYTAPTSRLWSKKKMHSRSPNPSSHPSSRRNLRSRKRSSHPYISLESLCRICSISPTKSETWLLLAICITERPR